MNNKNTVSFIRWQFRDCHKSLSFWGFMISILALVMLVGGCPGSWPFYVLTAGVTMTCIDAVIAWYRFSRLVYQIEQDRIIRELKKNSD